MWGRTASHSAKGGICSKCMFLSCSHPSFTWSVLLPQIGLECCPRLVMATWTESGRKTSKEEGKAVDCNRNAYVAPETYIRMCGQAWNGEETNAWETVMWWERKSCIILYHTITTKLERGTRARTKYTRLPFLTKIMSLKSSPMLYFFKWGMKILLKKRKSLNFVISNQAYINYRWVTTCWTQWISTLWFDSFLFLNDHEIK